MGHCSSIALGLSLSKQNKNIICIDGDGSMIMHLGSIATIAALKPRNFKHILLNNKVMNQLEKMLQLGILIFTQSLIHSVSIKCLRLAQG